MFHCCSRDEIVRATTELARSFATIGLLRHVTDATPADMVCTYIIRTNQPWGIKNIARNITDGHEFHRNMTVRESHMMDRVKYLPSGIVRMSKDYLVRSFWKQIDHLRSSSCMRTHNGSFCDNRNLVKMFPKEVVKTLGGLHITQTSRIWDARNAIGALHAACTPTMLDKPSWLIKSRWQCEIDKTQFDILRSNEERNLSALLSMLDNYCWQTTNRQTIPNDIEKGILLDLIESLLVMFGPGGFAENYVTRQVYEYARLQDSFAIRPEKNQFSQFKVNLFDDRKLDVERNWCNGVDDIIERLRHLSPQAAICAGYIGNGDYWDSVMCNSPEMLRNLNPQPLREVAIYLKTEMDVQRQKKCYAGRVMEAIKRGEFDPSRIDYSATDKCHCCDPCECGCDECAPATYG